MFNEQRQKQTGNGQQAKTGISEAEQRRKQYQAGVEVTGTGSEFQGRAVQGSNTEMAGRITLRMSAGAKQDFAVSECLCAAFM